MNRLLEDDTFIYTYDANGNLITKMNKSTSQTTTYTHDSENQLIRIDFIDGTSVQYGYDGLGRRISRSFTRDASPFTLHYLYDGEDILMEYEGTNQLLAYYTHGPGIDEPLSVARDLDLNGTFDSNEHFFYHTDALGSVTAITDSTGSIIESYQYDSFGNPTIYDSTNTVIPESLIGNPYLFTSREFDPESGLYYLRARYYDPKVGRFISEEESFGDWVHPTQKYVYTSANPVNFSDPYGDTAIAIGVGIGGSFGPVGLAVGTVLGAAISVGVLTVNGTIGQASIAGPIGAFCPLASRARPESYPGARRGKAVQNLSKFKPQVVPPANNPMPPLLPPDNWWKQLLDKLADLLGEFLD